MAKGVAVKIVSYKETLPKILNLIKLSDELKKHDKIILKPGLFNDSFVNLSLMEEVLKFCLSNKNPEAELFIAEGYDGKNTTEVFDEIGYAALATKYGIGLIDLNHTETEQIQNTEFLGLDEIHYPKILKEGFVVSIANLMPHESLSMTASLHNMVGAFPAKHYKGFFSSSKSKLNKVPLKYQVHDILKCKMPNLAIIDVSNKGMLLIGQPLEIDKQATKLLGIDWRSVSYLKLIDESFAARPPKENLDKLIGNS